MILSRATCVVDDSSLEFLLSCLRAGDILFSFADSKPGHIVRGFQGICGYQPMARNACHVAVYCGDGEIIHAVSPVITKQSIKTYFAGRIVAATTWELDADPKARADAAETIVQKLLDKVRHPYTGFRAVHSALSTVATKVTGRQAKAVRIPTVCSTIVEDAFTTTLRQQSPIFHPQIANKADFPVPAHIFCQPGLVDILPQPR
jgi:hypothetical protein